MTAAQFKGYYQGYVANMPVDERVSTAPADILNAKVEDLATSVDWRTAQSPKGAMGLMQEELLPKATPRTSVLSGQHLVPGSLGD